jgi:hypothetical protein
MRDTVKWLWPEIDWIKDAPLPEQVTHAWARALERSPVKADDLGDVGTRSCFCGPIEGPADSTRGLLYFRIIVAGNGSTCSVRCRTLRHDEQRLGKAVDIFS